MLNYYPEMCVYHDSWRYRKEFVKAIVHVPGTKILILIGSAKTNITDITVFL